MPRRQEHLVSIQADQKGPHDNVAITALSVAVALIIDTIELVSVLADKLSLKGAF